MKIETNIALVAEEGASLSSGSLRLYALPYGCIDLYNYDPLNRRSAVGIMVSKEYRRQGYALAMLRALETQQAASLHTLYADIAESNTASISLFRKAGYEECGRFKEWLLVGDKYINTIRVQKILKENPYGVNDYRLTLLLLKEMPYGQFIKEGVLRNCLKKN